VTVTEAAPEPAVLVLTAERRETLRLALLYERNRCERAEEELGLFPCFTALSSYYLDQRGRIDELLEDLA